MGRTSNARQRLLDAASNLLWEKSYHSVTVDEVCARAGLGHFLLATARRLAKRVAVTISPTDSGSQSFAIGAGRCVNLATACERE